MPADPNLGRNQTLKDIASSLKSIDGHLKTLANNSRPRVAVTNYTQGPNEEQLRAAWDAGYVAADNGEDETTNPYGKKD